MITLSKKYLFKVMSISLFIGISSSGLCDSILGAVESNKHGVEALKKQNSTEALSQFSKAIGQAPFLPELQLNLGLAFDISGNQEKAKQAYESAEKILKAGSSSKEAQFVLNFNLGELAGRQKNVDVALGYYQQALEANPESVETKTNIELLIQQKQNSGKDNKDQKDDKDKKDGKDQKDQKDQDKKDPKDGQDKNKKSDQDKDKEDQPHQKNKPQPRPFKSEQLSPGDVKKILEEMDRQEQKVRAEFNKKQMKEKPRDKDW